MTQLTQNDPWAGILSPNEDILWQGSPEPGFSCGPVQIFGILFGLAFSGFALFWMILAMQADGLFWMFGLIHFTAGLAVIVGNTIWPTYKRRHTFYTLTNKNAFIASNLPIRGKSLKSYPITIHTPIDYQNREYPNIMFATKTVRTKNGSREVPIGFERIADAPTVLAHIRKIQDATV